MMFSVFISCAKGLEYLLEDELGALGFMVNRVSPQGVYGTAPLAMLYRICLWSRLASRVHIILFSGVANSQQHLYTMCRQFAWDTIFTVDKSIAVVFHGESPVWRNSLFGAQVVKDAVVDYFREKSGHRPTVQRQDPDILLHAHLKQDTVTVSLDFTGNSLHQRGYRLQAGAAPLKENIAAAMLVRAGWPQLAKLGYAFHDPCCGAGTIVIEAAMMACNIAPGALRKNNAFAACHVHQPDLWDSMKAEAALVAHGCDVSLLGSDIDSVVLDAARANAARAGVLDYVQWRVASVADAAPLCSKGLLATNPPYGLRLGFDAALMPFYQELGRVLYTHYQGWQVVFLQPYTELARAVGLRSHKQYTLYNGALQCKLYCLTLDATNQLRTTEKITAVACSTAFASTSGESSKVRDAVSLVHNALLSSGAVMFANRLQKNYQHLQKWACRNNITCYRVYDADLPDYAFAIDIYADCAVLQEYAAPLSIDPEKAALRRLEGIDVTPGVLGISADNLVVKLRQQQKGPNQYQKLQPQQFTKTVTEGHAKLKVNLTDYLDTGLFLDHRLLRLKFAQMAPGLRFLNCYCYTASASVHAALAGAFTVNVDLSNTYLEWAAENFQLNNLDIARHQFIQSDVLSWLKNTRDRFDVIFLDPPSFSNSKRLQTTLDIQRDHEELIMAAKKLLKANGVLYFSTNLRQFKLSPRLAMDKNIHDITQATIDLDFKRNARIHQCFELT